MRVVAFVMMVVVFTILTLLGLVGFVLLSDTSEPVWLALSAAGLALALYGPLVLGSLAAWYRLRSSSDSGRHYRQWRAGATAGTMLGVALVLAGGIASGVPVWLLAVIPAVSIVLLLIAVPVGDKVRRSADAAGPRESDAWTADTSAETRRVVRVSVLTFAIALAVSVVGWLVLSSIIDEPADPTSALALSPLPFLAAGFACTLLSIRLSRRARAVTGHDFGRLRTIVRVVLKGADDELDEEGMVSAARYAALAPAFLGTQLGFFILLYTGLIMQFTAQMVIGSLSRALPAVMLAVMVVVLGVIIPMFLVRIRRARTYAADHHELLTVD